MTDETNKNELKNNCEHPPFVISETEWADMKILLDKRYAEIAALLRYNKTKDESIQRLGAEVQKYRDGFAFFALKPFINALILFREDSLKSIRDEKQFAFDGEKTKKYIEYLVSDFEELLSNIALERDGNSISINGKQLSDLGQPKELQGKEKAETAGEENKEEYNFMLDVGAINNMADLIENLNKNEKAIRLAFNNRAMTDKTIKEYIELASRADAMHYFALVTPVAKQLYGLYDSVFKNAAEAKNYSGETLAKSYVTLLEECANGIRNILMGVGIEIETLGDVFDAQKHKLLKTIPTENKTLDRAIATIYTNCYTYEGKVVYQSKVDVYKFQQQIKGDINRG